MPTMFTPTTSSSQKQKRISTESRRTEDNEHSTTIWRLTPPPRSKQWTTSTSWKSGWRRINMPIKSNGRSNRRASIRESWWLLRQECVTTMLGTGICWPLTSLTACLGTLLRITKGFEWEYSRLPTRTCDYFWLESLSSLTRPPKRCSQCLTTS